MGGVNMADALGKGPDISAEVMGLSSQQTMGAGSLLVRVQLLWRKSNQLNITLIALSQETDRLAKAFKDPKFLELFADYAREISDPRVSCPLQHSHQL
jgi:hypothetical protein